MPARRRKRRGHLSVAFGRLSPVYKALVGLVAPIGTIVGMLLALNIIHPFGDDALAASVQRTSEATTAAITMQFQAKDRQFAATGDFDYRTGWGQFRYEFGGQSIDARLHGSDVYLRLPELKSRPWVHADTKTARADLQTYAQASGQSAPPADLQSLSDLDASDPSQVLERLQSLSDVEKVAQERIFGVATDRYKAVVDPRREGERPLQVTAWVDGDGLIRRLVLAAPGTFTVTMNFLEFGKPVDIRAPRPGQVRELGDVLDQLLAG